MSDDKFVEILDELLGEKLYDHDQKKEVKRYDMGKCEHEDGLTYIRKDIEKFYHTFADSLKNIFGYITYKNFLFYMDNLKA